MFDLFHGFTKYTTQVLQLLYLLQRQNFLARLPVVAVEIVPNYSDLDHKRVLLSVDAEDAASAAQRF